MKTAFFHFPESVPHGSHCTDHYQQQRAACFRVKVPSLSPSYTSSAYAVSLLAEQHFCPRRVALRGDSVRAPELAQVKVATELERGDHRGNLEHWTFRDIQPV